MSDIDALKNRGVLAIGAPPAAGPKTIIVVGVARGATSVFAGALHKLGVFMGDKSHAPVFEDVRLAVALESGDFDAAREVISEYDTKHEIWGFKRPGIVPLLERAHALFRQPVYLFVFRDIFSIAQRNQISMKSDVLNDMRATLRNYGMILDFIEHTAPQGLLLSTEKTLTHTETVFDHMIDYLGLSVTPAQRKAALAFVQLDPPQYLQSTRLHFLGSVDRALPEFVAGWALIRNHPAPANLVIRLNGDFVGTTTADISRPDLVEKGVHPTGQCGFRFMFPPDVGVAPGDEVSVQFQIGGEHLTRSPSRVAGNEA
jgi:hypothetical protein